MKHDGLMVTEICSGPFQENCFVLVDEASRRALIVDPGDGQESHLVVGHVRENDLEVQEILCTHGHIDHAGGVVEVQEELGVPFAIHRDDLGWLERLPERAARYGLKPIKAPEPDRFLSHDDEIELGSLRLRVIHTPGHSAGGCCFHFEPQRVVIVGDTLFAGSIGRSDLMGGSMQQLLSSIGEHLLTLDDDTVVYCGHGPATDIGSERRQNPFLRSGFLDRWG